jgi:hypothetical protein
MRALLVVCAFVATPTKSPDVVDVTLVVTAFSSRPHEVGAANATVRIESVWISLRNMRARPATSCKRSSGAVIASQIVADVVKTVPSSRANLERANYCALELSVARARRTHTDLRGSSIVVRGRRADGVRFVLRSRFSDEVVLTAVEMDGFVAGPGHNGWILGVDLARWFVGVDLASREVDGRREIEIDENSNPDLLATFEANVARAFALFADEDNNQRLDDPERARPLASHE